MILQVGEVFDHRFCVECLLGSGGSAVVYAAVDVTTGQRVALKIPTFLDSGVTRERGTAWTHLRCSLTSPHTVRVLEVSECGPRPYWVMEFVVGATLDVVIRQHGPFSSLRARRLLLEILDGLAEAHGVGLIHRDIRPANVIISDRDQAKLLDYERSVIVRRPESSGQRMEFDDLCRPAVGARFAAPEDLDSNPVGPPTDLYSVGLIAWHMLTGLVPFAELSSSALLYEKFSELPHRLAADDLHPGWSEVITQACEKDPRRRYASAEQMMEGLDGVLD